MIILSNVIRCYQKLSERKITLKRLNPKEVAKRLGVSVVTLRRWDKKGILKAHRTLTNRYYYTEEQINQLDEDKNDHIEIHIQKKPNLGHLNKDGTITLDSDMCSGTYNLGINYVFSDAVTFHDQTETTIKHVPAKLTIDEKLKEGQNTVIQLDLSKAAYQTIQKADRMHLLDCSEIEYFELEHKVFGNNSQKEGE